VTNPDIAAEIRVLNTLIGAGVGVAFNLIYPPAMPSGPATRSLLRVAEAAAAPLDAAGDALVAGPVRREQVELWLDRVRSATRRVAIASDTIASLRDSRRFNPRALGTIDVAPVLATGLDNLEHCLLAVRALFVVLAAEVPQDEPPPDPLRHPGRTHPGLHPPSPPHPGPHEPGHPHAHQPPDSGELGDEPTDDPYGEELRSAFAVVLHDVADCLRAFGGLVVAEAQGREEETEQALAESLEILRETQAILAELIMVEAVNNTSAWLLRGSILTAVQQVLAQLNLEARERVHRRWQEEQERRPLAQLPPFIQGVLPHPEHPYIRGLEPAVNRLRPTRPKPPAEHDDPDEGDQDDP